MTEEERQVLEFVRRFHQVCLEEQDMEQVGQMISDDIEWTGAGRYNTVKGRENILYAFEADQNGKKYDYQILNADYAVSLLAGHIYSFSGSCYVRGTRGGLEDGERVVRATGICRFEDGVGYMMRLHHSLPNRAWESDLQRMTQEDVRVLRSLVGLQSKELEEKNSNLDALIQNIPGGVICCRDDEDLELIFYSDGFLKMFGYTRDEMETVLENKYSRMIVPEDLQSTRLDVIRQMKNGNTKEIEYRVICKDGSYLVIQDNGQLVMRDGQPVFYCILIDITERRKADEELKMSLERYQIILNQSTDIIFEWDIKSDTLTCSPNWIKKFGYQVVRDHISEEVLRRGNLHNDDKKIFVQMQKEVLLGSPCGENEIRIATKDGRFIWCRVRYTLQTDQDKRPARAIGLIADIDKEKREKERLLELAEQDSLTGLYNRGAVQTLIQRYVVKALPSDRCALMILDVDNFKKVNDIYGHLSGDAMLRDIADMLRRLFPENAVLARVGGDEFAVLLYHVKTLGEVEEKADGILKNFRSILRQQKDIISCSIGISIAPENGDNFASIYKNADAALYQAKRQGKNRYALYAESLEDVITPEGQTDVAGAAVMDQKLADQNLTGYVLDILSRSNSMEKSINQLLEIVGRQVDVCRVYIFEDDEDGIRSSNTFEWCKEGVQPEKENLQSINMEALDHYYDNFNEEGIFFCRDVSTLLTHQRMILENQGIKSVLQCRIMDQGKPRGFMGFDECMKNRYWTGNQIRLLQTISRILGIFLMKGRAQERLGRAMNGFSAALEEQRDWFYILDMETCQFLYTSRKVQEQDPAVVCGGVCYRVFFGADRMCEGCPMLMLDSVRTSASSLVWNRNRKCYVHTRAQAVLWPGGREACMISCRIVEGLEKQREEPENSLEEEK